MIQSKIMGLTSKNKGLSRYYEQERV